MGKGRLEAFSDGVIAIIITIMVLELKVPHGDSWASLIPSTPVLGCYVLSFIYIGIYWNNHHHLLHACKRTNGTVLWANLHLLFWLSLVPYVTNWMGDTYAARVPVICYGVVLLMSGVAYYILVRALMRADPGNLLLAEAIGSDRKGLSSICMYIVALGLSAVTPWLSLAMFALVALMWLAPDRRIEQRMAD